MEQSYNVFFNNRVLTVAGIEMLSNNNTTVWQKYTNSAELQHFVDEFRDNPSIEHAIVYGDDTQHILHEISKCFKFIEAAGGVVKNVHNELLFIHRLGAWDLPKGKIEKGENPAEAAQREVMEECGIGIPKIDYKITDTYHIYFLKGKHILKRTHWFAMVIEGKPNPTPQTEENITQVCWKKEWADVLENTYPSIIEVLNKVGYK